MSDSSNDNEASSAPGGGRSYPQPDEPPPTAGSGGPTFNDSPEPLAGVTKWANDVWRSTAGKTVSLRIYIGSVIGVVVLMMLARCGG